MTADRLRALLVPETTAVVTMELQQGVVGAEAPLPALASQVEQEDMVETVGRLCDRARSVGSRVLHCTHVARSDGVGQVVNTRLSALVERARAEHGAAPTEAGSPGAAVLARLLDPERDIEVARIHGLTPFPGTSLDQILRNLGVTTVIATGVSVNVGVFGLVLGAVDRGYQVVLPRDAVTGVPRDYVDSVIDHSLAMLATVTLVDEILDVWDLSAARG